MPKNFSKFNKAVISGWNLKKMKFWQKTKSNNLQTPYGKVRCYHLGDCVFIPRHGIRESIPPHRINHRANIFALKKLGVKYIFAVNSVGSLKKEIRPGNIVVASDYISWDPQTFYEHEAKFIIPSLSLKLKKILMGILKKLRIGFGRKGVYFQTKGPRFETRAEIRILSRFADVVGMTMANEATLADELGLEYISVYSIDNYANGVVKKAVTIKECWKNQLRMAVKIERIIEEILKTKIK